MKGARRTPRAPWEDREREEMARAHWLGFFGSWMKRRALRVVYWVLGNPEATLLWLALVLTGILLGLLGVGVLQCFDALRCAP